MKDESENYKWIFDLGLTPKFITIEVDCRTLGIESKKDCDTVIAMIHDNPHATNKDSAINQLLDLRNEISN